MGRLSEKNKRLLWFVFFTTVFTYSLLAYLKLVEYLLNGTLFAYMMDGRPYVKDFCNVYNASLLAERCLHGHVDIYDRAVQDQSLREIIKPIVPELPFYLQYPPCFFALLLPLSLFSLSQAWVVWVLLGGLLIAITTPLLLAHQPAVNNRTGKIMAVLLTFSAFPTWLSYTLGQTSLYTYPAVVYMLSRLLVGKGFSSGLAGIWAFVKLQYAPVLILAGLIRGRLHFLAGAAVAALFLVLLSVGVLGVDNVIGYPRVLLSGETGSNVSGVNAEAMQNIRGLLTLLMVPAAVVSKVALLAFLLSLLLVAWLWLKVYPRQEHSPRRFQLFAALSLLIALAASPHTHSQDYMLASIATIWIWINLPAEQCRDLRARSLRFLAMGFIPFGWITFICGQFLLAFKTALPAQSALNAVFLVLLPPLPPLFVWNVLVQILLFKEIFAVRAMSGVEK